MLVVHYGTPHTGRHPSRIADLATDLGLRLLSVTRPGFGGSPRRAGRTVADVVEVLDRLGVDQVATAGYSGGGPHALALAALLSDRVGDVATFASPAPYGGSSAWFAGMAGDGGGLRPAAEGRETREAHQRTAEFDPSSFTGADYAALEGDWSGIGEDAQAAGGADGDAGEIDDDLAFVAPWGVGLGRITGRVSLFQGEADRIVPAHHADRLSALLPTAEIHVLPGSGHVAVLERLPGWMRSIAPAAAAAS
ncbi:alpha/beta fold hydrolase, partial [Janibacter corallicola]|uniref:alpha/beta fold hydrolase n=1 Tax=Janibacter corallicola TaxID=415212 RepID=UPI001FE1C4B4